MQLSTGNILEVEGRLVRIIGFNYGQGQGRQLGNVHVCHITLHASETKRDSRTSGQASLGMQLPAYPSMTHPIASGMIDPMHNLHMLGYSSSCGTSKPTHKANCVGDRLICWRSSALSHVAFSFCTGKVHVKLASSCQRALNGQPDMEMVSMRLAWAAAKG